MKRCTRCKVEKELSEFSKNKKSKDGLQHICKSCAAIEHKEWHEKNKEHIKEYSKEWYENNKERVKESAKEWRINNKEYRKEQAYLNSRTIKGKYNQLKANSKPRGLEVQISFEQYTEILKENKCYYCDMSLTGTAGCSLNRVDNNKGYLIDNVKPCCKFCNSIMNNFTKEELKNRVYKIIKRME